MALTKKSMDVDEVRRLLREFGWTPGRKDCALEFDRLFKPDGQGGFQKRSGKRRRKHPSKK